MNIQSTRPDEFKKVSRWFNSSTHPGQVDIYGISGYGGIGKSYLLSQVLDQIKPATIGYLPITVDGSDSSILSDFMALYERRFLPKTVPNGAPENDYFPRARKLARKHAAFAQEVQAAFKKASAPVDVKKAAESILKAGAILNKVIPKTKEYLDIDGLRKEGLDDVVPAALDLLESMPQINSTSRLPSRVKDILGINYSERIRSDLYGLSAEEWVADLCPILKTYKPEDKAKFTHSKIQGLDRLLLIIDDFEILGKTLVAFITASLIPALERSNFHTTLVILGRDSLGDSDVAFQHHLSRLIREEIRIQKFPDHIAMEMFRQSGHSEEDLSLLLKESQGYPFLVTLLCQAKGGSVSFYQQFYERTTRWMAPAEKKWVLPLCHLENINVASISSMLPEAPADAVMAWFKKEASLRDPAANCYVIAPYIRRTLKEYHKLELGGINYKEFEKRGVAASKLE